MIRFVENQLPYSAVNIKSYKNLNFKIYQNILEIAKKIKNQKIIHINSTAYGGGVAELLRSQVISEKKLGLKSHWLTIEAPKSFFVITKKIHNLLQGKNDLLTEKEKILYLTINKKLGKLLRYFCQRFKSGIIIIHDPQPLPLISFIPTKFFPILRLHIDLSSPNPTTMEFFRPYIMKYRFVVISNPEYRKSMYWLPKSKIKIIMPAIDPLSLKNKSMNLNTANRILEAHGINTTKPIITQISRFDPWKDPLGVIRAYYLAKNKIPNLQLVLAGFFFAKDDPEAKDIFEKVKKHAKNDPDIHLFSNPKQLKNTSNDIFINALYTASTLIIQKSIREGFGLTITEAMWKEKPVIAGITSGTSIQIKNRKNGILVESPEKAAKAIINLIKKEELRKKLGKAAKKSVQKRFLFPRYLLDNLKLYLISYKKLK